MRVVVACDWFLKYACEQAAALADHGHDVMLVHRSRLGEFDGSQAEQDRYLGIARRAGVEVATLRGENRSLTVVGSTLKLRARLAAWRPEIIHLHPNSDHWLWLAFAARPGSRPVPQVLTVHDPTPHPGHVAWGRIRSFIDASWMRRAAGLVLHGQELARLAAPLSAGRPVAVIPHGVRIEDRPLPVPADPTVLMFGRLEAYKGIPVLMAAMQRIWACRDDVRLLVAGTGPCEDQVIVHPKVERQFRYIAEDEVDGFFSRASLVVAPYTEASQSGVLSRAIGQGVPVVVSDQGSLADMAILDAAVVPAGDPDALASAVLALIDHGAETRQRVLDGAREGFSWATTAELITPFYTSLLTPAARRESVAV